MPVFYMLCSKDMRQGHQGIPIEIALKYVFKNMENVRPSVTLIVKVITSFNIITTISRNNHFCWNDKQIEVEQIECKILFCHYHAMKA